MNKTIESAQYVPTSILPANGLRAVYCQSSDDSLIMYATPLDFVGLADVTREEYERPLKGSKPLSTHIDKGVFIGIEMHDGFEHIVNDAKNFCGFARPGDDLTKVDSHMSAKYRAFEKRVTA